MIRYLLVSLLSALVGFLSGLLVLGIALENSFEKYIIGLSGPLAISISVIIAGYLAYRGILENRDQSQRNRTVSDVNAFFEKGFNTDAGLKIRSWVKSDIKNDLLFKDLLKTINSESLASYHKFALELDRLALGVESGTYHEKIFIENMFGLIINNWLALKHYIAYIRSSNEVLGSQFFCAGIELFLKNRMKLNDNLSKIPAYSNDVFHDEID